jgi:hypothetical protein
LPVSLSEQLPFDPKGGHTLRELDERAGLAKGSAFRAFKALALRDGVDYRVLHPDVDSAAFARLREAGRLYPGALRAIVLSDAAGKRVARALQQGKPAANR